MVHDDGAGLQSFVGDEVKQNGPLTHNRARLDPELDFERDSEEIMCGGKFHWLRLGLNENDDTSSANVG
jgi:hypothetical protein